MLWALAVITVRKKHHEALLDIPLSFTSSNHGIDNNLCSIGEVTKLCFPNCQGVRMSLGITILEAENGIL
jgi:hypothetical protein